MDHEHCEVQKLSLSESVHPTVQSQNHQNLFNEWVPKLIQSINSDVRLPVCPKVNYSQTVSVPVFSHKEIDFFQFSKSLKTSKLHDWFKSF